MDPIPPDLFLEPYPAPIRALAGALRVAVRQAMPDAIEGVRAGWHLIGYDVPSGRRTVYFAYVAPEHEHVQLGFEYGAVMDDPDGVLLGRGITRQVRWLTFRDGDPVDPATLAPIIREAARVARMSRGERLARALDR